MMSREAAHNATVDILTGRVVAYDQWIDGAADEILDAIWPGLGGVWDDGFRNGYSIGRNYIGADTPYENPYRKEVGQ